MACDQFLEQMINDLTCKKSCLVSWLLNYRKAYPRASGECVFAYAGLSTLNGQMDRISKQTFSDRKTA